MLERVRAAAGNEPLLWRTGMIHLAIVPAALAAMALDPRTVDGVDNWLKPTKFLIGGGLYCLTIALLLQPVAPGRSRTYIRWATSLGLIVEQIIISTQAARGVPSHFAQTRDLDGLAYAIMGWAIAALTIAAALLLVRYLRDPAVRSLPVPLLTSIRLALAISLIGSIAGGTMSGINSHSIGQLESDTGAGLPGVAWSTEHGDLRPAHFAGLHAIQVLPAFGWLASRNLAAQSTQTNRFTLAAAVGLALPSSDGRLAVWLFAAAYAALVVGLFALALAGLPIVPR